MEQTLVAYPENRSFLALLGDWIFIIAGIILGLILIVIILLFTAAWGAVKPAKVLRVNGEKMWVRRFLLFHSCELYDSKGNLVRTGEDDLCGAYVYGAPVKPKGLPLIARLLSPKIN